eukprot:3250555-Pyramimonas_sp.AAC.1
MLLVAPAQVASKKPCLSASPPLRGAPGIASLSEHLPLYDKDVMAEGTLTARPMLYDTAEVI